MIANSILKQLNKIFQNYCKGGSNANGRTAIFDVSQGIYDTQSRDKSLNPDNAF